MPDHVVDSARQLLGGGKIELDELMADLNEKRAEYEALIGRLRDREAEAEARNAEALLRIREAEAKKREMLAEAHREALDIVSVIKRQMRLELDEIRKKEKRELQDKIKEVEQKQKQIADRLAEYAVEDGESLSFEEIHVGDMVFVRSLGYDGAVSGVIPKAGRVKVISGSKEVLVPLSDIRIKKGRSPAEKGEKLRQPDTPDETVSSRINLVGMHVDEALSRLEPFLNRASVAGLCEVTIIHGYGTGALGRAVREHLAGHPLVDKFRHGEPSEGSGGVTVVTLV